ncbi:hypothetical protein EC991_003630 [Linnemannia zychae]|nr:hypothetical protein EC991_003630 [Linnemannia zychae]
MLLLVPSHKPDEEGAGKDASRVLVLLSSDTDISSNVVVPDTAITTTLGTNDTLEALTSNYPQSPFFNPATAFFSQPKHSRDHLGILQPSRPDDPFGNLQQPTQQSNTNRIQDRMDDSRSRRFGQLDQRTLHPYGGNDTNYGRARRHSHTGLVEFDHSVGLTSSGPRMRARHSILLSVPYQHQPLRTPRLLRGAFRKARKEQSPLLTSASFGTDYEMQNPAEEWEDDDIFLPWKTPSSTTEHTAVTLGSSSPKSLPQGARSLSLLPNPRDSRLDGEIINNKDYVDLDSIDSSDDIDLDVDDSNTKHNTASTIKSPASSPVPPKRGHRDSSEIVDVDGLSDGEMAADEPSNAPAAVVSPLSNRARVDRWLNEGIDKKTVEERTDVEIDLENSLDADMNTILGMASDMELVMPKFDDTYLQDLDIEPSNPAGHRVTPQHSTSQGLSSFHRDIDILRRHREELKEGTELLTEALNANVRPVAESARTTLSSSASPPSLSTENQAKPASQGPIYFKPSHHSLPSGPSEQHAHQNVMIIQSNQWTMDSKGSTGTRVFPPQSIVNRGNEGNHIYMCMDRI